WVRMPGSVRWLIRPWFAVPVALALVAAVTVSVLANANDAHRFVTTIAAARDNPDPGTVVSASPLPTAPPDGTETVLYPASSAQLTNPERGFMHYADCGQSQLSAATLAAYRAEGVTLVFCMVYLRSFRTTDINAATLQLLQRQFDTIRTAGLKTV